MKQKKQIDLFTKFTEIETLFCNAWKKTWKNRRLRKDGIESVFSVKCDVQTINCFKKINEGFRTHKTVYIELRAL